MDKSCGNCPLSTGLRFISFLKCYKCLHPTSASKWIKSNLFIFVATAVHNTIPHLGGNDHEIEGVKQQQSWSRMKI